MDFSIEYPTGSGPAAVYIRQRNFAGKYANFVSLAWDSVESADTKAFFSEPDPVNASGFFSASFVPIAGANWPLEVIEEATGIKLYAGATEAAAETSAPTIVEIGNVITAIITDADIPTVAEISAAIVIPDIPTVAEISAAIVIPDAPTLVDIRAAMIADFSAGLYAVGSVGEFELRVGYKVTGTNDPIPDVTVLLFNADSTVALDRKSTDALGFVTFRVNAGAFVIHARKFQYSFGAQTAEIVNANVVLACEGLALLSPVVTQAEMQILMVYARELSGSVAGGDEIIITPAEDQAVGNSLLSSQYITAIIGANGAAEINGVEGIPLLIGSAVRLQAGSYFDCSFTVDSNPVKNVTGYL